MQSMVWRSMRDCEAIDLGRTGYTEALAIQQRTVDERKRGLIPDRFLLVEHPHVVTLGRNARDTNVLASPAVLSRAGVEVHATDR